MGGVMYKFKDIATHCVFEMLYERIEQVTFHTGDSWRVWLSLAVAVFDC